jgi:hypothetical protein
MRSDRKLGERRGSRLVLERLDCHGQ